jgi:hypothetical protein
MQPVDRDFGDELSDPIDRLLISLRAYVTRAPRKPEKGEKADKAKARWRDPRDYYPHIPPSDWVLVFDCETRTTPDQRLRIGAYQLMEEEIAASAGERIRVLTRAEFVDQVFYESGYAIGAQIVGFNLPFDLSRLAIRHARRSMRGGFSLVLSEKEGQPAVAVKHLSQRAAM